jgi:hypothetical protein
LTVLKDGRSLGEVVFVDQGESGQVPLAVRDALTKSSGSLPRVALSDSSGIKVYGTSDHAALLKEGLDGAMRNAKRAMRDDQKNGPAPKSAAGTESDVASSPVVSSTTPPAPSGSIKVVDKNGAKEILGAPLEKWTSYKGSTITARVIKVSAYQITMVSDAGKTLTLDKTYLSTDSTARLERILEGR